MSTYLEYVIIALMGHVEEPVGYNWIVWPQQNGSVFDWFKVMDICFEEILMFDQQRLGISLLTCKNP